MEQYRINLAGFGLNDDELLPLRVNMVTGLEIIRKGDIWNKKTGKEYAENIIRLLDSTTYETGFSPKIDGFIKILESNPTLKNAFQNCTEIELQIRVTMRGDETGIPSIQLSSSQMQYLSSVGAHIDIDVVRLE